jgi:hypothetical protein
MAAGRGVASTLSTKGPENYRESQADDAGNSAVRGY